MALYITIGEFWELAMPPDTMFGDKGYRAGTVKVGPHSGTSTGIIGYIFSPRDYFYISLKCISSGSTNRLNAENPSGLPTFQASQFSRILIGTQVSGNYILPKATGSIELVDPGLGVVNLTTYVTVIGSDIKVYLRRNETEILATDKEVNQALQTSSSAMALISSVTVNPNSIAKTQVYIKRHASCNHGCGQCFCNSDTPYYLEINPHAMPIGPIDFGPDFVSGVIRITPDQDEAYLDILENGLRFVFKNNGSTDPAFIANDIWEFSTEPSKELLRIIQAACDYCDKLLSATYDLLMLGWGEDFKMVVAHYAKWFFILRRGLDKNQEFKVYEPKWADEWLRKAASGAFTKDGSLMETPPGTYFAELVPPLDLLRKDFPI